MVGNNLTWQDLFPRLDRDENARWQAYAELEIHGKQILFHGHTHVQAVWYIAASGAMTRLRQEQISIDPSCHYVVGVGSVGKPESTSNPQYAIYDDQANIVTLCTLV
jgi:hypothetical protein